LCMLIGDGEQLRQSRLDVDALVAFVVALEALARLFRLDCQRRSEMRADGVGGAETLMPAIDADNRCSDRMSQDRSKTGIGEDHPSFSEQTSQRLERSLAVMQFQ